MLVH
jgi:hypothetical protein